MQTRIEERDARTGGRLECTFNEEAALKLRGMTGAENLRSRRAEDMHYLACILDGEAVFDNAAYYPVQRRHTFSVHVLPTEMDDLAALLRGGELPVKLDRASVRETPVAPRR